MKTLKIIIPILIVIFFSVSGCSPAVVNPTETTPIEEPGYPAFEESDSIEYPSPQKTYENTSDLKAPQITNEPIEGSASISGLIYVPESKNIVTNTLIYLVPAEGENNDQVPGILIGSGLESRGDIISKTDENGIFFMDNIPPGNYFLIISFTNNIIIASKSAEDLSPRLFKFSPNESVPLGLVVSPGS